MKIIWPVDKKFQVSQWFGDNKVSTAAWYKQLGMKGHNGIDYSCPTGTEIKASHDGEIIAKTSNSFGNYMYVVNKADGIMSVYGHLHSFKNKTGDKVKQGDVIAISNNTGIYTTGAHLHFGLYLINENGEIKDYNNGYWGAVDPVPYFSEVLKEGDIIKAKNDPAVYIIKNGFKWWLANEEIFEKFTGQKINEAKIKIVGLDTLMNYKFAGIIGGKNL